MPGISEQGNVRFDEIRVRLMDPQTPRLNLDADGEMGLYLSIKFGIWRKELFNRQICTSPSVVGIISC